MLFVVVNTAQQNFDNEDIERLDEDVRILNNMLTAADGLSIPHQVRVALLLF